MTIIEGRTITNLAELRDYVEAAVAATTEVDPATIYTPVTALRLVSTKLTDDSIVYDLQMLTLP